MTAFPAPVWGPASQRGLAGRVLREATQTLPLAIAAGISKPRAGQCCIFERALFGLSAGERLDLLLGLDQILYTE